MLTKITRISTFQYTGGRWPELSEGEAAYVPDGLRRAIRHVCGKASEDQPWTDLVKSARFR